MSIIIMASYAGSGKDTVADKLIKDLGNLNKLSLGENIHKTTEYFSKINSKHIDKRIALQSYAESMRDIFGEDIWIKNLEKLKQQRELKDIIIPDVRKFTEFSHFYIERGYEAIYVKTNLNNAFKRIQKRDGEFNPEAMKDFTVERQLSFIEELPQRELENCNGLKVIDLPNNNILNHVAIIENNGDIKQLNKKIESWEDVFWNVKSIK